MRFQILRVFFLTFCFWVGFLSKVFATIPDVSKWGFSPGDGHIHTKYSDYDYSYLSEYFEKEAPNVFEQYERAKSLGYSWIFITDHEAMIDNKEFKNLKNQIDEINRKTKFDNCDIYLGIEMGNNKPFITHGHFLAYNISKKPIWARILEQDRNFEEVLKEISEQGGFGFVAHPTCPMFPWQRWDLVGIYLPQINGYLGLEWLNGGKVKKGEKPSDLLRDKVLGYWSKTRKVPICGNSDAHWPDDIGSSFTYLSTKKDVKEAFKGGYAVISSGPFAACFVGDYGPGDEVPVNRGEKISLKIRWATNEDLGRFVSIKIWDKNGWQNKNPIISFVPEEYEGEREESYVVEEDNFLFLEGETEKGKVVYANPVFLIPKFKITNSLSLILVLDNSESIFFHDPFHLQRNQIKEKFVNFLNVGDSYGVIYFDGSPNPIPALTKINTYEDIKNMKSFLDNPVLYPLKPGTDIDGALKKALQEFEKDKELNRKAVILCSDGVDNIGGFDETVLDKYQERGIRVYTILITSPQGNFLEKPQPELLKKIAEKTNGRYFSSVEEFSKFEKEVKITRFKAFLLGTRDRLNKLKIPEFILVKPKQVIWKVVEISKLASVASFAIEWSGSKVSLVLVDPEGKQITPQTKDLNVACSQTNYSVSYLIKNPKPGKWKIRIEGIDVPLKGEKVKIIANTVSETPPEVIITAPSNGKVVSGMVNFKAQAKDNEKIKSFALYLDGKKIDIEAKNISEREFILEYELDTQALSDGYHRLTAVAFDEQYTSNQKDVLIIVDNQKVMANAGEDRVIKEDRRILFDGSLSSGYIPPEACQETFFWDFGNGDSTATILPKVFYVYKEPGVYVLRLKVIDEAGNFSEDTALITVKDVTPPTITIKGIKNGQLVKGKIRIKIEAKDNVLVESIGFFVEGKLTKNSEKSVLEFDWDTQKIKNGEKKIKIVAVDDSGNKKTMNLYVKVYNFPYHYLWWVVIIALLVFLGFLWYVSFQKKSIH